MELLRITRQIHRKAVEQRATLIHRQYNRDCGTSYSRPPIDPYLTSPLLQNPGGTTVGWRFGDTFCEYNTILFLSRRRLADEKSWRWRRLRDLLLCRSKYKRALYCYRYLNNGALMNTIYLLIRISLFTESSSIPTEDRIHEYLLRQETTNVRSSPVASVNDVLDVSDWLTMRKLFDLVNAPDHIVVGRLFENLYMFTQTVMLINILSTRRLAGLSYDVVCVIQCLAVLIEHRLVTDTNRHRHATTAVKITCI